jgi:hypothetical protein
MRFREFINLPTLSEILVSIGNQSFQRLDEDKWVNGRFDKCIRIDQPTHGVGQTHAHIYGRKGTEIGVVNFDGPSSHGTQCRLSDADAALRDRGFTIKPGNIVEWTMLPTQPQLLFG